MLCGEIIFDYFDIRAKYRNTGLFEMIVGVLTTSPDATPCDFFLWGLRQGYHKGCTYTAPVRYVKKLGMLFY